MVKPEESQGITGTSPRLEIKGNVSRQDGTRCAGDRSATLWVEGDEQRIRGITQRPAMAGQ
jgi:hypothetical protein